MALNLTIHATQWRGIDQCVYRANLMVLDPTWSDLDWEQGLAANDEEVEDLLRCAMTMSRESPNDVHIMITLNGVTIANWPLEVVNLAVLNGVVYPITTGVF